MATPEVAAALGAAIAHHRAGDLATAERLYGEVLARQPGHPDALHFLGLLAHQAGDHARAVELLEAALRAIPHHAACHLHLGLARQARGELDAAEACYREALALEPGSAEAANNLGYVLALRGEPDAARPWLEQALAREPGFVTALVNLGLVLEALGEPDAALASLDRALALAPADPAALLNRGNALHALGRTDEAIAAYRALLAAHPGHADAQNNLGQALEASGDSAAALAAYRAALALRPDHATARFNAALAALRLGDFATGWRDYEWRWQALGPRPLTRDYPPATRWRGDAPIAGRRLFLHYEQGLGDTLQMLRYVPLLIDRGARVTVEVPPSLAPLAATLRGSPVVLPEGAPLPAFDLQCPLMSLPLACGTTLATVPADVPYLEVPGDRRARWAERLGPRRRPRVGLAWSGSTGHREDRRRSLPFAALAPLLAAGGEWHSLQKEYRAGDREALAAAGIRDWSPALGDFADTAALVAALDLVICVDTSVAHLAGALARPTWVLLASHADCRWLLGRDDSPWYPTLRLFRQRHAGDWDSVIAAVAVALAGFTTGANRG